jgi:hypothetical protein
MLDCQTDSSVPKMLLAAAVPLRFSGTSGLDWLKTRPGTKTSQGLEIPRVFFLCLHGFDMAI